MSNESQIRTCRFLHGWPFAYGPLLAGIVLTAAVTSAAQGAQKASGHTQEEVASGELQEASYRVAPIPAWVKPTLAFDPQLEKLVESTHGFHSRLHDFQYNGITTGASSYFNAVEYALTNQYGVENYSSIEISFDPSYELLALHELSIRRGDQLIDKLPSARFDMLRTESDRSRLIYDGTQTLAIVLDDVRTGDIVRYSYSVEGENPVYFGHREFRVHTELWSAVDRQYTRVLTSVDKPLNRRVRGNDVPLQVSERDGIQEIVIDQRGVEEFSIEDDVPSWHYNRGTIVFSDMKDWRSVVDWVLPMYELPEETAPEIATMASVIRASTDDERQQIAAALRWVQEEIRYFGVELGKNSHLPSPPEETLARRFGDCKDKALLLIAVLRELGIEAQPALVNTNRGLEAANYPYRMHAFDHVMVHLNVDGETHFIDPTLRNQSGDLGDVYQPDYGLALVLTPETNGLTQMGNTRSRRLMSTTKSVTLEADAGDNAELTTQNTVTLEVASSKRGLLAEYMRARLETDGLRGIEQDYVDYYRDHFDGAVSIEPLVIEEAENNGLSITERYQIPAFWQSDENVPRYRWLYADEIIGYLDEPEKTYGRQQPYELRHPVVLEEIWNLTIPESLVLDDLDAEMNNEWVSFSKESTLSEDGRNLSVTFRYQTLTNEVAAEDLVTYKQAVRKIRDLAMFYVEDEPVIGAAEKIAAELTEEITRAGATSIGGLLIAAFLLLCKCLSPSLYTRRFLHHAYQSTGRIHAFGDHTLRPLRHCRQCSMGRV